MPTMPMENVKYDGVGTMQPRPLALEHDNYVDVEKGLSMLSSGFKDSDSDLPLSCPSFSLF